MNAILKNVIGARLIIGIIIVMAIPIVRAWSLILITAAVPACAISTIAIKKIRARVRVFVIEDIERRSKRLLFGLVGQT
jgi:hypothetical protein